MAVKAETIEIKLVRGHFSYKGKTYKAGPLPFKIDREIAEQLLSAGVAVIPKVEK